MRSLFSHQFFRKKIARDKTSKYDKLLQSEHSQATEKSQLTEKTQKSDQCDETQQSEQNSGRTNEDKNKDKQEQDNHEKGLDDQIWFHGFLPRTEMNALLIKEGDWLVRLTYHNKKKLYVISVRIHDSIKHIILEHSSKGFLLMGKRFKTLTELVTYYTKTGQQMANSENIKLIGRPIDRPKWLIRTRHVVQEKKIGGGAFGEVFTGKLLYHQTEIPCAIKTIKVDSGDKNKTEEFMKEAKIMMQFVHNNVVRFYGVAADETPLLLVMELCPKGALDSFLQKNKGTTTMDQKIQMILDAARGMTYLADKKKCVHRDLAARNCLLGVEGEVKIADFGLSQHGGFSELGKNAKLPIKWTAPEVIKKKACTFESDVWSFGIMMWEILADAEEPWSHLANRETYLVVKKGEKMITPPDTPKPIEQLMHKCWNLNPMQRPSMRRIQNELEQFKAKIDNGERQIKHGFSFFQVKGG